MADKQNAEYQKNSCMSNESSLEYSHNAQNDHSILQALSEQSQQLGESLGDEKDNNGSLALGSLTDEPEPIQPDNDTLPNLIMDTESIISSTTLAPSPIKTQPDLFSMEQSKAPLGFTNVQDGPSILESSQVAMQSLITASVSTALSASPAAAKVVTKDLNFPTSLKSTKVEDDPSFNRDGSQKDLFASDDSLGLESPKNKSEIISDLFLQNQNEGSINLNMAEDNDADIEDDDDDDDVIPPSPTSKSYTDGPGFSPHTPNIKSVFSQRSNKFKSSPSSSSSSATKRKYVESDYTSDLELLSQPKVCRLTKDTDASPKVTLNTKEPFNKSDVEIMDKSIEIVYEKPKKVDYDSNEVIDSQDLELFLTSDTQTESFAVPSKQNYQQTDNLVQPSKQNSQQTGNLVQGSMTATQIEEVCDKGTEENPTIKPLIKLPLKNTPKTGKSSILIGNHSSTNGHDVPIISKSIHGSISLDKEEVSQNEYASLSANSETVPLSSTKDLTKGIKLPVILTPCSEDLLPVDVSESLFTKVSKAAKANIEKEKQMLEQNSRKDSLDSTQEQHSQRNELESPIIISDSSAKSTPVSVNNNKTAQVSLLHSSSIENERDFEANLLKRKGSSTQNKLELLNKDKKKTSTPNCSAGVSPNVSDTTASMINKSHSTLEANTSTETNDTEPIMLTKLGSLEEAINAGYVSFNVKVLFNPSNDQLLFVNKKDELLELSSLLHQIRGNNLITKSSRISNFSSLSGSSGGYRGDKSASSLESTRRESILSRNTNDSKRLSIASTIIISSPTDQSEDSNAHTKQANTSDNDFFIVTNGPQLTKKHKEIAVQTDSQESVNDSSPKTKSSARKGKARRGRGTPKVIFKIPNSLSVADDNLEIASVSSTSKTKAKDTSDEEMPCVSIEDSVSQLLVDHQTLSSEEIDSFSCTEETKESIEKQASEIIQRIREVELKPGILTFSRFTDNAYYSAILQSYDDLTDRWKVKFTLDDYETTVREVHVLPTDILPKGHNVLVRNSKNLQCDPGVIKGYVQENSLHLHIVETDKGNILRVPHSNLILTGNVEETLLNKRLSFRSLLTSPAGSISLDNVIGGKRRRKTPGKDADKPDPNIDSTAISETDGYSSPSTSSRGTPRKRRGKTAVQAVKDIEMPSPGTPKKRGSGSPQTPNRRGGRTPKTTQKSAAKATKQKTDTDLEEETEQSMKERSTPLKKRRRNLGQNSTKDDEEVESIFDIGPIPPKGSSLFKGLTILITSSDSAIHRRNDPEDDNVPSINKDHLKQQIINGGGKVIDTFEELELINCKSKKDKVFCISNSYSQTEKFLRCLIFGLPIVSSDWIKLSCIENRLLDWDIFLLPAGMDLEFNDPIDQKVTIKEKGLEPSLKFLKSHSVYLATSSNSSFSEFWLPLLCIVGADIKKLPSGRKTKKSVLSVMDSKINLVFADETLSVMEKNRALELDIPMVSSKWFIQSVIVGKKLPYDSHSSFKLEFLPK